MLTRLRSLRWQDAVAALAGLYAILSPIWTANTTKATWTMVVLGALTMIVGLGSLLTRNETLTDGALGALGVLFFISPWVLGFTGVMAMAWTAWIVGAVVAVMGAAAYLQSYRVHHHPVAPTH